METNAAISGMHWGSLHHPIASPSMGRTPCCDESGLKKGPWTPEEDLKLVQYIEEHGHGSWRALPKLAGLNRCGKSCRLRWTNYLRPDIKRGKFSPDEEQTILHLHSILGNKWSAIASHLPGRTDNEIKNFWNTHLKKKLIQMGFDPMTHRPRTDFFATLQQLVALAKLRQLIGGRPWDDVLAARLEAESSQAAELQYLQHLQNLAMASSASDNLSNNLTSGDLHNNFLLGSQTTNPFSVPSFTPAKDHVNGLKQTNPLPEVQNDPCCLPVSNEANQSSMLTGFRQGESSLASPFMSPHSPLPPLADISFGNQADASSTSNCGSGSENPPPFWPELLFEDPFMADFA